MPKRLSRKLGRVRHPTERGEGMQGEAAVVLEEKKSKCGEGKCEREKRLSQDEVIR